jgi:hypothetical protein
VDSIRLNSKEIHGWSNLIKALVSPNPLYLQSNYLVINLETGFQPTTTT